MKDWENKLIKGDCIKVMKTLSQKDIIFDAIITDPPYNISRKNNFHTLKGRKGIDFGSWDKTFEQLKWLNDADPLLKDGGSIIIFNDWKNIGEIAKFLNQILGYEIKDVIRWVKKNPMPRNRSRRYITDYEFAIWLTKGKKKWTFNSQNRKYQRPEIKTSLVLGNEKTGHPTQKSLELMKKIIKIHTNKGDKILDPFAGSGTTCLASHQLKRRFVGIEKDKKYFKIAAKRLAHIIDKGQNLKSPFNYLGAKYKHLDIIKEHFPKPKDVKCFYDAFLGSGEVLFNTKYKKGVGFEINHFLIDLLIYLKDNDFKTIDKNIKSLITKFKLTKSFKQEYEKVGNIGLKKYNQQGYNILKKSYNQNPTTIKLIVLILYGFNNQIRFNSKNQFNIPVGKSDYTANKRDNLLFYSERIKRMNYRIFKQDFFSLPLSTFKKGDFIFFDPPYLITLATYNESNKWNEKQEMKLYSLLSKLTTKGVRWCLTNVLEKNGQVNHFLQDFMTREKLTPVHLDANFKNYQRKKGKTVEILVKNYDIEE